MFRRYVWMSLLVAMWGGLATQAAEKRPNIVFFLVDDLGYADCGFNGGREIQTPNIDRLAQTGSVIESHYVQNVCSPTRAALMTGRYATRTGVYTIVRPHAPWGLPLEERTLADALKSAGYTTAITGKWHLGEFEAKYRPTARGFEHQYGHYFGMIDYNTHMRGDSHDWYRNDRELKEEGYTTHLLAAEACRLIESQDRTKPLFLYVPFNGVHSPFQVPDKYVEPYGELKGNRKQFAGMLAAVDEAIGRIVGSLERAGMRDDTLIVFSSDNGGPPVCNNGPLRDHKGSIYEGGVRAAAFANWPKQIPAGARVKEPMHVIDWYPTLIRLAGGSLEQKLPLDGRDVWPMLTRGERSPHEAILSALSPTLAAVRMDDWKLIMKRGNAANENAERKKKKQAAAAGEEFELYDLKSDPGEKTNLIAREIERAEKLKAKLAELMRNAVPSGVKGEDASE